MLKGTRAARWAALAFMVLAAGCGGGSQPSPSGSPRSPQSALVVFSMQFAGRLSGYLVQPAGGGAFSVTSYADDSVVAVPSGVKQLVFTDYTVALDATTSNAGPAYRLYRAAFARQPDFGGLGFWINALDHGGATLRDVAAAFIASDEFVKRYGGTDNTTFVSQLYLNVLQRAPDVNGLLYFKQALDSGAGTRADVLIAFSESAENVAQTSPATSNGIVFVPWGSPVPDPRSGDYVAYAVDGHTYMLTLDFDTLAWRFRGDTLDKQGSFGRDGSWHSFQPDVLNLGPDDGFEIADGTIVGRMTIGSTRVPFMATNSFVHTVADAAGAYKIMSHAIGGTNNNFAFGGDITADGTIRTCGVTGYVVAACPAASVVTGTVAASGTQFAVTTSLGTSYTFRVATIAGEKMLLRSGLRTDDGTRRFWVGLDQDAALPGGFAQGPNTDGLWAMTSLSASSLSSALSLTWEVGPQMIRSGVGSSTAFPGLVNYTTQNEGVFMAMQSTRLSFVFSAHDNPVATNYVEIGLR